MANAGFIFSLQDYFDMIWLYTANFCDTFTIFYQYFLSQKMSGFTHVPIVWLGGTTNLPVDERIEFQDLDD